MKKTTTLISNETFSSHIQQINTNRRKTKMNKKLLIFGVPILALAVVSAVAIFLASVDTTVTVSEAFDISVVPLTVTDVYTDGIEHCVDVLVTNSASVPLNAQFTWIEDTNVALVTYTTDADTPRTDVLTSGANSVPICFTVATDSPVGVIEGHVTVERVA